MADLWPQKSARLRGEAALMPTIVDFPTIVKDAVDIFGDLFANEPERRHFAEYLTGLMVAEKKTVSGINRGALGDSYPSAFWRCSRVNTCGNVP